MSKSLGDAPGAATSAGRPGVPPRRLDPPSLERMRRLTSFLGSPELDLDVVHITGTNGKGSVARIISSLLAAEGISVGMDTSPHLERINERFVAHGNPISDAELAELLTTVALAEEAMIDAGGPYGEACSFFELSTAAALRWFGDLAVEAAVIEVGLGGTWDATNVADGRVAVLTNVDLDHTEFLGSTRAEIAADKLGIVKPGATLVLGLDSSDHLAGRAEELALERGAAQVFAVGRDFACEANRVAVGGRVLTLRTPGATYEGMYLPLHGAHQGENAARALCAAEAFIGAPLPEELVVEAFANVRHPGRMEVMSRSPLVVLDGAHNVAGARAAATTLRDDFSVGGDLVVVMGILEGRDADEMLVAFGLHSGVGDGLRTKALIAVAPPSDRAQRPERLVAAAESRGVAAEAADTVENALERAKELAGEHDLLLVTGSLYLIGAARALLRAI